MDRNQAMKTKKWSLDRICPTPCRNLKATKQRKTSYVPTTTRTRPRRFSPVSPLGPDTTRQPRPLVVPADASVGGSRHGLADRIPRPSRANPFQPGPRTIRPCVSSPWDACSEPRVRGCAWRRSERQSAPTSALAQDTRPRRRSMIHLAPDATFRRRALSSGSPCRPA